MPDLALDRVVEMLADTLDQMAFVTVCPMEEPPQPPPDPVLVSIEFEGPHQGRIDLLASRALGTLIAANVLASSVDDPQAHRQADDALRELLNVTCGALLSEWTAAAPGTFHMQIPQVLATDASHWRQVIGAGGFTVLDADGHVVAVRLLEM